MKLNYSKQKAKFCKYKVLQIKSAFVMVRAQVKKSAVAQWVIFAWGFKYIYLFPHGSGSDYVTENYKNKCKLWICRRDVLRGSASLW